MIHLDSNEYLAIGKLRPAFSNVLIILAMTVAYNNNNNN